MSRVKESIAMITEIETNGSKYQRNDDYFASTVSGFRSWKKGKDYNISIPFQSFPTLLISFISFISLTALNFIITPTPSLGLQRKLKLKYQKTTQPENKGKKGQKRNGKGGTRGKKQKGKKGDHF